MQTDTSLAAKLYERTLGQIDKADPADQLADRASFSDALEAAARDILNTLQASEETSTAAIHGDADVQQVVEAIASAEMALQTVTVFRDRIVEAYQEILRMPV